MGRAMERFPLSFSSCESPTSSVARWAPQLDVARVFAYLDLGERDLLLEQAEGLAGSPRIEQVLAREGCNPEPRP